VYFSTILGTSVLKIDNLPITQFYRFYVDPQNGRKIYGGTQDNSTTRTTTGKLNDWEIIYGGDGFQPLVDPNNSNIIFALSQFGNLGLSTNNGASFVNATGGITSTDRKNWDTPIVFDPQDSRTLYYGTQRVWKTTNRTVSWTPISSDLTNGFGGGNLSFGTITSLDVSPLDSDFILAGTDDGNVWVSKDGGANWSQVSATLPNLWTTKVLADRNDLNTIYVTFSGYRYGDDLGHVFKSEDAGMTWEDIGSDLPDIPVNDIVKDRNDHLYLATDVGVFFSDDDGESWEPLGENMPPVVVTDLHIHEAEELLYAATYGRSAYKADISQLVLSTPTTSVEEIQVYPNPSTESITFSGATPLGKSKVVFYDRLGKVVDQREISELKNTLDVSHLSQGVYYLKILGDKRNFVQKLILK
ncbi:MAG: T9SS type A sorting domain-containing protein, partial [Bacteroidota bacterium]